MQIIIVSALCVWMLAACGNDSSEEDPGLDAGSDSTTGSTKTEELREVPCVDQSISRLPLFDEPAAGAIRDEAGEGDGFYNLVDATGGGLNAEASFVYARFTDDGLEKVSLSDEEAFESLDWHVAFRRYVVRLNSGVSGPGEVTAARTRPNTLFAELTSAPDGLEYRTEEYFTASCEYVPDTSGIGAPATALSSFWKYQACVQMTKNVYVLSLPSERQVKLEILSYYSPDKQKICDETGQAPMPSGAGNMRIRWDFVR
jgi:hypothetical protein